MIDTEARTAWQLFHLNWLPIATMGSLLALGLSVTGLRLEPVAYGITLAIAALFIAIAYRHRIAKGDLADPKLVFSLGTIGQVILTCAIVGPLSYVAGKMSWPLQDQALLAIDRALGLDPEPIARQDQLPLPLIPQCNRKHPVQVMQELGAMLLIEMDDYFCIARGSKHVTPALQLFP